MLLTAIVLILAFLALTAMVARVSQLGSTTTQEQSRPILVEIDQVQATVDRIIRDLNSTTPKLNQTSSPTFLQALNGSLRHLAHLERARGFTFEDNDRFVSGATSGNKTRPLDNLFINCGTGSNTGRVAFNLSDGQVRVQVLSRETFIC